MIQNTETFRRWRERNLSDRCLATSIDFIEYRSYSNGYRILAVIATRRIDHEGSDPEGFQESLKTFANERGSRCVIAIARRLNVKGFCIAYTKNWFWVRRLEPHLRDDETEWHQLSESEMIDWFEELR